MHYATRLTWTGNRGSGTGTYTSYGREFRAEVAGKRDLEGSADKSFRGDPALHNPEDLLLVAVASCHMLSYLALCARAGITVLEYTDEATGTMSLTPDGGGHFVEVMLRPTVVVGSAKDIERAEALHERAHQLCFIANSTNFPIEHQATVSAR